MVVEMEYYRGQTIRRTREATDVTSSQVIAWPAIARAGGRDRLASCGEEKEKQQ